MKNVIEQGNLKPLTEKEANSTEGGVITLLIGAFLLGRRVEYMKAGGGFTDFYL